MCFLQVILYSVQKNICDAQYVFSISFLKHRNVTNIVQFLDKNVPIKIVITNTKDKTKSSLEWVVSEVLITLGKWKAPLKRRCRRRYRSNRKTHNREEMYVRYVRARALASIFKQRVSRKERDDKTAWRPTGGNKCFVARKNVITFCAAR